MGRKVMTLALAAVSLAMCALPVVAYAGSWHLEPTDGVTTGPNITITGGKPTFTTASGAIFVGESVSSAAVFNASSTTTGTINGGLKFTGIKEFGVNCEQAGQPAGTVVTTPLTFHLEKIDTETPGILFKVNNAQNHFVTFKCLGMTEVINGSGLLGDVTNRCSGEFEKVTADWATTTNGQQKYKQVTRTGTAFDLSTTVGSGESSTLALTVELSLSLGKRSKVNCTLP